MCFSLNTLQNKNTQKHSSKIVLKYVKYFQNIQLMISKYLLFLIFFIF